MTVQRHTSKRKWVVAGAGAALAAIGLGFWAFGDCDICLAQQTIPLTGNVAANCSIVVTTLPAAGTLDLTTVQTANVQVGTILQNCNKKSGYTLTVASANCATPTPAGAKLYDSVDADMQMYSVSFTNPSGTSPTNLLASSCATATGRSVSGAKIAGDTSQVSVNYTVGTTPLAAGTYSDTLTITMNVN